jgi:hypothetical protein
MIWVMPNGTTQLAAPPSVVVEKTLGTISFPR